MYDDARDARDEQTHEEAQRRAREALGGVPETPAAEEGLLERCQADRSSLTPKETAECAGLELAESYENEEDGGS